MKPENVYSSVRDWARKRGIYEKGDLKTQFTKLCEEQGELAKAIINMDQAEFEDAIGDMVVVLTNLAELGNAAFDTTGDYIQDPKSDDVHTVIMSGNHISIESCLAGAWNEIKDRKGSMKNGSFVKEKNIEVGVEDPEYTAAIESGNFLPIDPNIFQGIIPEGSELVIVDRHDYEQAFTLLGFDEMGTNAFDAVMAKPVYGFLKLN
jgi:hypothetical protein